MAPTYLSMNPNHSNRASFWPMKMKLNGLLVIAVMGLAGCDQNEPLGIRLDWSERPHEEMDRLIKEMGPVPKPDPRANKLWGTDLRAAIMRARKNNKRILLAFFDSSSDHAGVQWNFIYTQPRFLDFAQKELELVKVDGSANPRADAEAQKLVEIFGVAGLPFYFVLDEEGRIVWPKSSGMPLPVVEEITGSGFVLDGVNRTSAAGTVPRSTFYFEKEKEFIKRLKLILKGTEPHQGKAARKTAGVPMGVVEVAIRRKLYQHTGELTKADLDRVTSLSLSETDVTDQDLKELVKVDQMTSLGLSLCPQVTNEGLKELGKLKKLNSLSLGGPHITDATLKELANFQQIVRLDLAHCPKVTDKGIKELGRLKNLKFFYLRNSLITKVGKSELRQALPGCTVYISKPSYVRKVEILKPPEKAPLPAEESAEIIETAIGQQLSKPTSELTETDWQKVTELKFTFTKISDASLKEVAKLDQLKMLWLDNSLITDEGLKEVAKLEQLTHLGLAGTYVTDAGIKDLAKLKNLSSIRLGRTNVTIDGVAALRRALPDCDIHYFR